MSASAGGGIRFGQYVLLRRIARGGMAEVFLAQQRGLEGFDRRVAVKRILPHLADAPDFVKMFLGEARLAAQLTHPNIVHIYDFGKHEGDYFIAMEYVEGVHAGQLFKHGETEKLSPTMVARIGADAATALHYAHELRGSNGTPLGLVHRDVSPANLMVSFDGVVKLCDFGIAKAAALGDQLTNPGHVKGKYAYMSPEQTIAAPLDGRSDVFSLAIVLWELLAGRTLVGRGDAVEAMRAIRDGKLTPIAQAAPHTPPALAKAITWALQNKREQRPTAMDFAQALEAFIKSSPELATPMQLGAWIRQRFEREVTGPRDRIPGVSVGTRVMGTAEASRTAASPGTVVAPGTAVATVTPPSLTPARVKQPTPTVSLDTRHVPTSPTVEVLDLAETIALGDREVADRATVLAPPPPRTDDLDEDSIDETRMRSGAFRAPVPPGAAIVPTVVARSIAPGASATELAMGLRPRRGPRLSVAIAGLVGLAVLSFLLALAIRSDDDTPASRAAASSRDAGVASTPTDAEVGAIATDAPPTPPAPVDAEIELVPDEELTYLEIRTNPRGGTVRIGGETRADPAKFALAPGRYRVVAELDGYRDEKRTIELQRGVDLVQEIAFRRKRAIRSTQARQPGRLTVRTTPYSIVFHNGRRLGETPFADLELPAGTYTLVFRNPEHPTVTRRVTITPGKTTKLSFALP